MAELTREEQLKQMSDTQLRKLALSFNIQKPITGWQDAIPEILEREKITTGEPAATTTSLDTNNVNTELITMTNNSADGNININGVFIRHEDEPKSGEVVASPDSLLASPAIYKFPTEYYQKLGFPTCPKCGDMKRTANGLSVCSIGESAETCPNLQGG